MGTDGGCCGGNLFIDLEPAKQAEYLAMLAQDARLLQFALQGEDDVSRRIGALLQRALEQAIDADGPEDAEGAGPDRSARGRPAAFRGNR
jgi:hypothetical protein